MLHQSATGTAAHIASSKIKPNVCPPPLRISANQAMTAAIQDGPDEIRSVRKKAKVMLPPAGPSEAVSVIDTRTAFP